MSGRLATMRAAEQRSAGKPIESYPIRLFAHHMAEIFGISLNAFYKQDEAGAFDFALTKPTVGRKAWSRDRVKQHFDGTLEGLTPKRSLRRVS